MRFGAFTFLQRLVHSIAGCNSVFVAPPLAFSVEVSSSAHVPGLNAWVRGTMTERTSRQCGQSEVFLGSVFEMRMTIIAVLQGNAYKFTGFEICSWTYRDGGREKLVNTSAVISNICLRANLTIGKHYTGFHSLESQRTQSTQHWVIMGEGTFMVE